MSEQAGRERVASVLFYAAVLLLAWAVYRIFEPFLVPLGWATVLVVVFHPWQARLEDRWGTTRAALLSTLGITIILVLPVIFLLSAFIGEGVDALRNLRESLSAGEFGWFGKVRAWAQERIPGQFNIDFGQLARQTAERVAAFFAQRAGGFLRDVAVFFFDLFVMLFSLFFLFRDRKTLLQDVRRLLPFEDAQVSRLFAQAQELIQTSVTSSFLIAGVQGFLGGVTFAALGLQGAIFWGVTMAFLALIPLLGTGMVIAPAALWLVLNGQVTQGLILAGVGFGIIGTVDNFLRPILVGTRTHMSALVLFISVMGGIGAFGMLGLVLGPIVVATAKSLFDVYGRQQAVQTGPGTAAEKNTDSARPVAEPVLELAASEGAETENEKQKSEKHGRD